MDTEPFKLCPRFDFCNINHCPLHPDFKKLISDESDPQQKCTLPKSIRKRLGSSLSWEGLTKREISGQKIWDSLPEEIKQARIKKISERSLFARLSMKGYAITPKRKDKSETHIQNDQIPQNSSVERGSSGRSEQRKEVQGVLE